MIPYSLPMAMAGAVECTVCMVCDECVCGSDDGLPSLPFRD